MEQFKSYIAEAKEEKDEWQLETKYNIGKKKEV